MGLSAVRRWVAIPAAIIVVAGCGAGSDAEQALEDAPAPYVSPGPAVEVSQLELAAQTPKPSRLVGMWWVSGAGVEMGTVLRLGYQDFTVFGGRCSTMDGSWNGRPGGLFAAHAEYWNCPDDKIGGDPEWIARAVAFRAAGNTRQLLDAQERVLVTLRPGARVEPDRHRTPELSQPPKRVRSALARLDEQPTRPPKGLVPARRVQLLGTWVPADSSTAPQSINEVHFGADGLWRAREECTGVDGRWVIDRSGRFASTAGGIQAAVGCANIPVAGWVIFGAWAGFVGDMLVLVDIEGHELGRLVRSGALS